MEPARVMDTLAQACRALEAAGEHAAAAYVGHAMDLVSERYGVGIPPGPPPCGDPD